jgi:16S rRNA (guanine966-N2)-methyltransferase
MLQTGMLRIIAGSHRGRKWRVPDGKGLRPTPDRIRETLFNWLAPNIHGACVLDVFAGSGALGLEALSRGAAQVTFVEQNAQAVSALKSVVEVFGFKDKALVLQQDALKFLKVKPAQPFDIVLLDPPFQSDRYAPVLAALQQPGVLVPGAKVYLEFPAAERDATVGQLPAFTVVKETKAGGVGVVLMQRETEGHLY